MKPVAPERMHLTLAFVGWVADDHASPAAGALRDALAARPAVDCRLGEIGAFPTPSRARVVWVGLSQGGDDVRDYAIAVRDAFRRSGVPFDDKPPVAHLTVARVRDGIGATQRDAIAKALLTARVEPLSFEIEEAVLFESRLARSGPTYIPLERVRLRPLRAVSSER